METFSDPLYSKVHALAAGMLEGTLGSDEQFELETLILQNPAARQAYIDYVQESACLRWLCVEEFPKVIELASRSSGGAHPGRSWRRVAGVVFGGGLACALCLLAANGWFFAKENKDELRQTDAAAIAVVGI